MDLRGTYGTVLWELYGAQALPTNRPPARIECVRLTSRNTTIKEPFNCRILPYDQNRTRLWVATLTAWACGTILEIEIEIHFQDEFSYWTVEIEDRECYRLLSSRCAKELRQR
jgi:hypothetical protein